MRKLLENKNAVITGTARGIGRAMVELFAAHGANIWACARKNNSDFEEFCQDLSTKYEVIVKPIYFELSEMEQVKNAVKVIRSDKRPIDILVNNAGITNNALFQMVTREQIDNMFNVNFVSPLIFSQYIVKLMLRNGSGSVINIASSAAFDGNPGRSIYGASKAAVASATKSMASELGANGIRVNAIAPGIVETDMLRCMGQDVIEQVIESADDRSLAQTEDIANAALFLASDMSSYVTSQIIRVDGGL